MITVLYTCDACGLRDRAVLAPEREKGDDVVHYVREILGGCIGDDHQRVSPHCTARTMTNLKIPIDPNDPDAGVGTKS